MTASVPSAGLRIDAPPSRTRAETPAYSRSAGPSPSSTSYRNVSSPVPVPAAYTAFPGGSVASARRGTPATSTARLNATVMLTVVPAAYEPLALGEVTPVAYADVPDVSIWMFPAARSDPVEPLAGSVRLAGFPTRSISMPLVARASVPA